MSDNVRNRPNRRVALSVVVLCLLVVTGCGQNMRNTSQLKPYESNTFFENNQSARPLVPNTVPRGESRTDVEFFTGMTEAAAGSDGRGEPVTEFPYPVTREFLERGEDRYNIYCAPCHAISGDGRGMIVERGFPAPPSFHDQRLRDAPVGHYYDVITNGFGRMYSYAARIQPTDRWAITAYIRALQLSQNATIDDVPAEERQQLQGAGQ